MLYGSESAMMGFSKAVLACAVVLTAVLSLFAAPVTALDRSEGDYWVYEGGMDYDGIAVTGGFRYEFEAKDSLTVGSESYDVNVLKVTGSMASEMDDLAGVEMVFNGFIYEVEGSLASVQDDMHMWTNLTALGTVVSRVETHDVSTYSPPLMTGFVDGQTGTGDEWDETTNVTSAHTVWVDEDLPITSTDEYQETCSYSVAAAEETVTTAAGTFTCLKITETDSSDNYEVYWYSSEVGSWVKMSSYSVGDTTPYFTLELTEYSYSGDSLVLLIVVGAVILIVVAIVVVLLLMRKRGQTPVQVPQQMPPPPPQTG
ncbi:MAG: hypothetical protein QG582_249 [Candidatus Thermoplasmatota archaeon]|nr:hypothetical protein [Candidatus Thermoplasmatota archaeon]